MIYFFAFFFFHKITISFFILPTKSAKTSVSPRRFFSPQKIFFG